MKATCLPNLLLPAVLALASRLQAAALAICRACRLQAAARVISEAVSSAGVFASPKAAAYWTYHLSRSSFFLLQGAAGELLLRLFLGTALFSKPRLCNHF